MEYQDILVGFGIHKCIGAPIAMLELRVLFEEILRQTSSFAIHGEVVRTGYPHFGFKSLPISFKNNAKIS